MTTFSINDRINELVKVTLTEKHELRENNNNSIQQEMIDESAKSPDFLRYNKPSEKVEGKYATTRIKSRNFLSNISYVGITMRISFLMFICSLQKI